MRKIKVGCYYSENSPYEKLYKEYLLPSCQKFNLDLITMTSRNTGKWICNVAEKPRIIGEMLDLFIEENERLAFTDVDSQFEQYPKLFEEIPEEYEIGYHLLNWNSWYGYHDNPAKEELLSGTMIFSPTKKVKDLCKEWYEKSSREHIWEQRCLQNIIEKYNLKTYYLPINYIWIDKMPRNLKHNIKEENIVIRHFQASREFKKKGL